MNIPKATKDVKLTLERGDEPKLILQFFRLEGKPGMWRLNTRIRSQQAFGAPSNEQSVIAVFDEKKDGMAFGEFAPADNPAGVDRLQRYGLEFYTPQEDEQAETPDEQAATTAQEGPPDEEEATGEPAPTPLEDRDQGPEVSDETHTAKCDTPAPTPKPKTKKAKAKK